MSTTKCWIRLQKRGPIDGQFGFVNKRRPPDVRFCFKANRPVHVRFNVLVVLWNIEKFATALFLSVGHYMFELKFQKEVVHEIFDGTF